MAGLIVISGLPGVGKTTVASLVALRLGAVHLSVDPVEDAMIGAGLQPDLVTGVAAYEAVRAAVESNLHIGRIVVVDAVNDSEPARETWRRAAETVEGDLLWVLLTCSDLVEHARRLGDRNRGLAHVGEPSWHDVMERARDYEPWIDPHIDFDTANLAAEEITQEVALAVDAWVV